MAYTRGVLTTGAGTYGKLQSIDYNEDGEEVLIKDENGETCVEDLYDEVFNITVSAKFDRAQTLPSRGDTVALAASPKTKYNTNYTITSMDVGEVNTDAATLTLNLRRFEDGNIPAS